MSKEVIFTKGYSPRKQGLSLDSNHYDTIQFLRKLRKKNSVLPPLNLSGKLKPHVAFILEEYCQTVEKLLGFNPLNGKSLPYSGQIKIQEVKNNES